MAALVTLGVAAVAVAPRTMGNRSAAETTPSVAPREVAPTPAPPPPPETAAPRRQILLTVEPSDAHVFRDGRDLGTPPLAIEVKPGDAATIVARRPGFREQSLTLNEKSAEKAVVKMTALGGSAPAVPKAVKPPSSALEPARRPQPRTPIAEGDFADPWKK